MIPAPEDPDLAALDWGELLRRLAASAQSAAGRALCLAPSFAEEVAEARLRMATVAELATLIRREEALPSLAMPETEAAIAAAEKGVVLGADELRPVAALCAIAEGARRFFSAAEETAPRIAALARDLSPPIALARAIDDTFDPAGEIRDSASPDLARLRGERRGLEEQARGAIEGLMRSEEYASVMQDQYFTIRAERYVLPLKASAKSLGLGIVHDTSRTGETVFVEPTALVSANNRLKITELEIRRESRRILEALTADVAASGALLRESAATVALLDARAAAARLAIEYDGNPIEIVDEPVVDLAAARHPLLALAHAREPGRVVANDVAMGGDRPPLLIVSGPNAGGKTVLMKTIGLAALMARAGLPVAAEPHSRVGFFDAILVDIGDRQSVLGDLSTFSAHLANIRRILGRIAAAGDRSSKGHTLVLLDELMAGTNPEQGAALARATAETLAERRVLGVVTTHYDSLKALAESDPRFANAGMEYDLAGLQPTFRLAIGSPGRSYAFDIAARMGLAPELLDRARALAGGTSIGLESAIARLEEREAAVAREAERLAAAAAEAAATAEAQRGAAAALERRTRELSRDVAAAIEAEAAAAKEELRAIVRRAQEAGTSRAAEMGKEAIARAAAEAIGRLPKPVPATEPGAVQMKPGTRVFVERLGAEGVILQPPDDRGRTKVKVGAMTIELGLDELRASASPSASKKERAVGKPERRSPSSGPEDSLALVSPADAPNVDLRGQTGDDALAAVEAALDRAVLEGKTHLVVVHGHGTGALRKRVRAYLAESPYVARWAPGTGRQGGDGVSIVELR